MKSARRPEDGGCKGEVEDVGEDGGCKGGVEDVGGDGTEASGPSGNTEGAYQCLTFGSFLFNSHASSPLTISSKAETRRGLDCKPSQK